MNLKIHTDKILLYIKPLPYLLPEFICGTINPKLLPFLTFNTKHHLCILIIIGDITDGLLYLTPLSVCILPKGFLVWQFVCGFEPLTYMYEEIVELIICF